MIVSGTRRAHEVIDEVRRRRTGVLTITLGTGCCESTAPFLYEDHYAGPDAEQVGTVADVPVLAPSLLRNLYSDDEELVVDVVEELAESLSIETELGVRFALRSPEQVATLAACEVPGADDVASGGATPDASTRPSAPQELPEHLRGIRIR